MKNEIKISLHPVQTKRASEEVYQQIRQLILDGEIHPGERLPSERKMMEMIQRSRPTIREAMRMLERDGYVKIYPGSSGAVIQEINVDNAVQSLETIMQMQQLDMENILEFRQMTESVAARLAAKRRTIDQLKKMEAVLTKAEESADDVEQFIDCDLQFHLLIAEATGNAMYVIMLQVCSNMIDESLHKILIKGTPDDWKIRYERILNSHRAIFTAVLEKKEDVAYREMETHLTDAASDI